MKILYIANIRLPTEKAHGIQIMNMCNAFAQDGHKVDLVIPKRKNSIEQDPFVYYSTMRNFSITYLPTSNFLSRKKISFLFSYVIFSISALVFALRRRYHIYYSRDYLPLLLLTIFKGGTTVWELHRPITHVLARLTARFVTNVVVITHALKTLFVKGQILPSTKVLVAPDGVDIEKFVVEYSKEEARQTLGLPLDKKLIVYTGHLYKWKGVDILAQAAYECKDPHLLFLFIGGTDTDIARFKHKHKALENVKILGQKSHKDIPLYTCAADVLVLPNSEEGSLAQYTSPLKLFEYMASDRPIVASNLSSVREILNDRNAKLIKPDAPQELLKGIQEMIEYPIKAKKKSQQALSDVEDYTWEKRAQKILTFVGK